LYAQCSKYDYYGSRRHGGFAEKLNVCSWNLLKLPHGVSLADGALVEPTAVVVHAIGKASIEPEKHSTLCILGAGFLGLIAVQVVRHLYPNCEVHLVDRNLFKLDVAEIHGASTTLVNNDKSWNNFLRKSESTFDRVIELAGTMATYTAGIMIAKPGARVVWGGNISEDLTISSAQVSSILRKEIEIVGTWNSIYKGIETCDWARALDLIANGLRPSELVSSKINLSEINSTISKLYNHKVRKDKFESIKVLVEPQL
jgi:threonine dehydrogenase-like Zn-dependent dehydrogenase